MVTKVNPTYVDVARSYNGKSISVFDIATGVDMSTAFAAEDAMHGLLHTVGLSATIIAVGALTNTNQDVQVWVEGDFPDDTFDGTNTESFAAHLEDTIQALGDNGGAWTVTLAAATVTAGPVYQADQVNP